MHDIKVLRENPKYLTDGLAKRGIDPAKFSGLFQLEESRRKLIAAIEEQRHRMKQESEAFAEQRKKGGASAPPAALKQLSDAITEHEKRLNELEAEFMRQLSFVPNVPHESVPAGDAKNNKVVRTWGEKPVLGFAPKSHIEIAEKQGMIDLARAAKISGSHFPLFIGKGARLERALIQWMLDVQTKEHGYVEVAPPLLVNRASMTGTGQLPKFEEDMYRLKDDDLFLIPTAEVPITNLLRDEIVEEAQLPVRYTAYTPCFRREAGSYGKETKGLVRVHQFDKVELVKFVRPETSYDEHEKLVRDAETLLQRLGLHYRVVLLAAGDLGFSAAKCYDLEAWAPGLDQFLEVSSCSNFEAFQARRANIRYRQQAAKKVMHVHTLNGSGLALARTFICLLETHQQADGRVRVPAALRPYLDGQEVL